MLEALRLTAAHLADLFGGELSPRMGLTAYEHYEVTFRLPPIYHLRFCESVFASFDPADVQIHPILRAQFTRPAAAASCQNNGCFTLTLDPLWLIDQASLPPPTERLLEGAYWSWDWADPRALPAAEALIAVIILAAPGPPARALLRSAGLLPWADGQEPQCVDAVLRLLWRERLRAATEAR